MTQQYALYVNEDTVKYPPKTYKSADKSFICFNFNSASPEILASQGYLPLVEDEQPECEEGYYLRPTYEQGDNSILVHWTVEELVEEEE